jgi:hypothetical protein
MRRNHPDLAVGKVCFGAEPADDGNRPGAEVNKINTRIDEEP